VRPWVKWGALIGGAVVITAAVKGGKSDKVSGMLPESVPHAPSLIPPEAQFPLAPAFVVPPGEYSFVRSDSGDIGFDVPKSWVRSNDYPDIFGATRTTYKNAHPTATNELGEPYPEWVEMTSSMPRGAGVRVDVRSLSRQISNYLSSVLDDARVVSHELGQNRARILAEGSLPATGRIFIRQEIGLGPEGPVSLTIYSPAQHKDALGPAADVMASSFGPLQES